MLWLYKTITLWILNYSNLVFYVDIIWTGILIIAGGVSIYVAIKGKGVKHD